MQKEHFFVKEETGFLREATWVAISFIKTFGKGFSRPLVKFQNYT